MCIRDSGKAEALVEGERGVDGVLAGHGVCNEENLARVELLLEARHLVHQIFINGQAAGGVHDERVAAHVASLAAGLLSLIHI